MQSHTLEGIRHKTRTVGAQRPPWQHGESCLVCDTSNRTPSPQAQTKKLPKEPLQLRQS